MSEPIGTRAAARRLGVHENTIRNWADQGRLPYTTMPGPSGFRRYRIEDVDAMKEQEIRVGQIWKRKRNGRLIRITAAQPPAFYGGPGSDDWIWEGEDYKGKGVSYGTYIRRDCVLVTDVAKEA